MTRLSASSGQKGFSLIEAVMVFAIIALLSAVAVPSLMKTKEAAEKASLIVGLRGMHTDQVSYHTTRNRYARLDELNEYAGSLYGQMNGSILQRKDWIYLMTPTPTNATLKTRYQTLAYQMRGGRITSAYMIAQDGVIQTLIQ
jgi:prepilin-type N-terminal cleavage/methylation domain-containing protein